MASGFSSSAVAELALFQEMHATSLSACGHSTLLVPFAVVKGTGGVLCHLLLRRGRSIHSWMHDTKLVGAIKMRLHSTCADVFLQFLSRPVFFFVFLQPF